MAVLLCTAALVPTTALAAEPPRVDAFITDVYGLLEASKTSFAEIRGEKRGEPNYGEQMYQNAKGLVGCDINVLIAEPRGRKKTVTKAISVVDFADGPAAAAFLRQVSEKILLGKVWKTGFRASAMGGGLAGDLVDVLLMYDAEKNPIGMLGQNASRKQRLALVVWGADWIAEANQSLPTRPSGATALPASGPERVKAFYAQFVATGGQMLTFLASGQSSDFDAGTVALQRLLELRDAVKGIPPTETGLKTVAEASFLVVDQMTVDTLKVMYDAALRQKVSAETPESRTTAVEAVGKSYKIGPAGLELAQRLVRLVARVQGGTASPPAASPATSPSASSTAATAKSPGASTAAEKDKKSKETLDLYTARDAVHRPKVKLLLANLKQSMVMDRSGQFNRASWPMMANHLATNTADLVRDVAAYRTAFAALGLKKADNELHDLVAAYLPLAERFFQVCAQWGQAIEDRTLDPDSIKGFLEKLETAASAMTRADRAVLVALGAYKSRNGL